MEQHNLEHWFLDKQGKLLAWREWRTQLPSMEITAAVEEAAIWWKFVPLVNKTFDPWRVETWPTPWELIGNGSFCPSAQGLGIFYSLILSDIDCVLALAIIEELPRLMVLFADNKLLNYHGGEVVDMQLLDLQILQTWTSSDLARLVKV